MASEMFELIVNFCLKRFLIFAQEIVDFNSLPEFLYRFESFGKSRKLYLIEFREVKIRITAEDSFHVVR